MEIIGIMLLGVLLGNRLFSKEQKKIFENIQFICVVALIFLMGVSLGKTEGFFADLVSMGFISVTYAIIPIVFSTILVFILTHKAFTIKEDKE